MNLIKYVCVTLAFLIVYYSTGIHPLLKKENPALRYVHFESQAQPVKMAYAYEKPTGEIKGAVLLLHGKNFSSSYWAATMRHLSEQGYLAIAPEQLGFGSSSQPADYQYSFQQLAENTRLLLDSLHLSQVIVLGHSMGGMLATRFALMYPGRCSRLILENPIGLEDWKTVVPYSSIDEEYKKELKKTRQDLKAYMQSNYFHGEWKADYEPLLGESAAYSKRSDFKVYAKNMALTSDMIFTQPVCYEFSRLTVPTVLIIGQKDKTAIGRERADAITAEKLGNYAALGKSTAAAIPGSRLLPLEGLGHIPHVENPQVFFTTLDRALVGE